MKWSRGPQVAPGTEFAHFWSKITVYSQPSISLSKDFEVTCNILKPKLFHGSRQEQSSCVSDDKMFVGIEGCMGTLFGIAAPVTNTQTLDICSSHEP